MIIKIDFWKLGIFLWYLYPWNSQSLNYIFFEFSSIAVWLANSLSCMMYYSTTTFVKSCMLAYTVPTFNSCTKCLVSSGIIDDCTPNCHPVSSQLNVVLVRKPLCGWFIFDTFSISVCTTSHRHSSGQLVQELNVCTVPSHLHSTNGATYMEMSWWRSNRLKIF